MTGTELLILIKGALLIIALLLACVGLVDELVLQGKYSLRLCCVCFAVTCLFAILTIATPNRSDYYYLEAEKYAQENNEVIFTTDQGLYNWTASEEYPESIYLLTMDDKGTKDTKDDEIVVVWESKN